MFLLLSPLITTAQLTPVVLTGFNHDVIAETGTSSLAVTTVELDSPTPSNMVMYSQAFGTTNAMTAGLPDNGIITSGTDTYQLGAYNANNVLLLNRGLSGDLFLATPASLARVRVLCFSAEGSSVVNISLSFTDGSTTPYVTNYTISDWFNGASNIVLQGFGRCKRQAAGPYIADGLPANPRFYYIDIALNCTDRQKNLQHISCSNVTATGPGVFPNAVFLGVSGIAYTQTITPTITPSDCNGPNGSIALNITGSSSPYTYSWNTSPVQTGATATGLAPGSYTCTVTDAGGCPTTYTGTVPLNNNAAMNASASPAAVCPGDAVTLSANVTTGNLTSFTWQPGNLSGQTVTVTPASSGTYTVTGTNVIGCNATASVNVVVNPVPAAPVVNGTTICPGNTATLQVQSPQPGYTYNWYDASAAGTLLTTGVSYTTPSLTNTTTYYVDAVNATTCTSAIRTPVTVTVASLPAAPAATAAPVCSGDNAVLQVTNPQPGVSYNWYSTATGGTIAGSGATYMVNNVTAPATWYVEAVNASNCNSTTRTAVPVSLIAQLPAPIVTLTNATFTSLSFSWNSVTGATSYMVTTNGGSSFSTPSSGPQGTTHTITGLTGNTTITLQVIALGTQTCETSNLSAPVKGTTLSSKEIFVPNVFTPNGDGRNDVLKVYGNYVASIRFSVFNQWGQLIYNSDNITNGWDGIYRGQPQPAGVYAYTLKVVLQDGTIINKNGSVNLVR